MPMPPASRRLRRIQFSVTCVVSYVWCLRDSMSSSARVWEESHRFAEHAHGAKSRLTMCDQSNNTIDQAQPSRSVGLQSRHANDLESLAVLIVGPIALVACCLATLSAKRSPGWHRSSDELDDQNGDRFVSEGASENGSNRSSVILLLVIACCSATVSQFARYAQVRNKAVQETPIHKLMAWINMSSWMVLAFPYALGSWFQQDISNAPRFLAHFQNDATCWDQAMMLSVIAVLTNMCFLAGSHYLDVSLTQSIFSTSPVFTLCFSAYLSRNKLRSNWTLEIVCVALAVCGVVFLSSPWTRINTGATATGSSLVYGVVFCSLAGIGHSAYCVLFKMLFGNRLQLGDVCMYLARLGTLAFVVGGLVFSVLLHYKIYLVDLKLVPWVAVFLTAVASVVFNLCKNLGLSKRSPITIDLVSQLGVTLSVLVDVGMGRDSLDVVRSFGILATLVSFSMYTLGRGADKAQEDWQM